MSEKEINREEIENQIATELSPEVPASEVEGVVNHMPEDLEMAQEDNRGIEDLSPEELQNLISQFNEDPDNVGYIVANGQKPSEEYEKELQAQLDKMMEDYQNGTVVIAPEGDKQNMVKYVSEFVKKHMLWEGSWWKTVLTLVEKLEAADKKAKAENAALEVDFVTCYVLNKIFNEDTIRSNYEGAVFMQKNLARLTYYGNRIALAYSYVTQFSKNTQTLQKGITCLKSGLNVEVTLPELETYDINTADEKSKEMVDKFKTDGII